MTTFSFKFVMLTLHIQWIVFGFNSAENSAVKQKITKVNGGRYAKITEYPFIVGIYTRGKSAAPVFHFTCGGSIYNRNYIITAGHCIFGEKKRKSDPGDIRVIAGKRDIPLIVRDETNMDLQTVNETFIHENFNVRQNLVVANDIGMIKLQSPLNYTSKIRKIRIPSSKENPLDGVAEVVGWGRTEIFIPRLRPTTPPRLPNKLRLKSARLRMLPRQLCTVRHFSHVPDSVLCVGSEGLLDSQSACFGDSGGPLTCPGGSGPYLCGLVSTGVACGVRFTPAFYTDVRKYNHWIRGIGGDQYSAKGTKNPSN